MKKMATWEQEEAKGPALTGRRAYAWAAILVGLALALRLALDSLWKESLPFGFFFLVSIVVSQLMETGPSVFAIVAGFVLGDWFFIVPRHHFLISSPVERFNASLYLAISFGILFFTQRTRQAQSRERAASAAAARLAAIIGSSDDAIVGRSLEGKIVSWNAGASKLYGYTEAEAMGQPMTFLLAPEAGSEVASLLERVAQGEHIRHFETTRERKDGGLVEVSLSISPVLNSAGQIVGTSTIGRDISERRRAERERECLLDDLQKVLGQVKTLSGLLPICAHCKKIRDDKGYWNQIELYIRQHSSASFTHSICPDCAARHYGPFLTEKPQVAR